MAFEIAPDLLPAYRMQNGSATSRHRQTKASQSLPRSKEISGSRPATRADKGAAEKTGSVNLRLGSRGRSSPICERCDHNISWSMVTASSSLGRSCANFINAAPLWLETRSSKDCVIIKIGPACAWWWFSTGAELKSAKAQIRARSRFFIRALVRRPMQSSSDWRANMRRSLACSWPPETRSNSRRSVQAARSGSRRKHFANCWMKRVRNSETRQLLPPRLVPVSLVKPTRRPGARGAAERALHDGFSVGK